MSCCRESRTSVSDPSTESSGGGPAPAGLNDRIRISACVVALNEEDRIGECLASLDFCDELLVVDSHSSDRTREIASEQGARVIERDWPGHVAQKEFAIRAADHDWVLCLDADERLSPELRREIIALRDAGFARHAGWSFPRLSNYLGTWVRHGSWYPNRQLRLFDRRRGHYGGVDPHDRVETDDSVGRLAGELIHYPYRGLSHHLRTMDSYTTLSARGLFERGRRASVWDLVLRPPARFLRFLVLRRGFLLGWKGLLLSALDAQSVLLKYAKLLCIQKGLSID